MITTELLKPGFWEQNPDLTYIVLLVAAVLLYKVIVRYPIAAFILGCALLLRESLSWPLHAVGGVLIAFGLWHAKRS